MHLFLEVSTEQSSDTFFIVSLIILFGFIAFCIGMATRIHKVSKKAKEERKRMQLIRTNEDARLKAKSQFSPISGSFQHFAGLPVAQNTACNLTLNEHALVINTNGTNFNLSLERINAIDTRTEKEIQTFVNQSSSAGKALAGAMMFGVPGALIGGRTKTTETKKVTLHFFLTVSYKKDDTIDFLVFGAPSSQAAEMFSNGFYILSGDVKQSNIEL